MTSTDEPLAKPPVNPLATSGEEGLQSLVRAVVEAHRHQRGPLIEILHDLQERLGYLPAELVPLVAAELNLSRADVHGVVTFYRDFRSTPPGRSVLTLCRAEACQALGAEHLVAAIEQELGITTGDTTPDGSVTLQQVYCLGNCALGPAGQVNGELHGRLDRARVLALLGEEAE